MTQPANRDSSPLINVRRNEAGHRFEAEIDGLLAVADYEMQGDTMVLTHTFIPAALRGRGMAEKLVRAALEHARTEKRRVVPACSYAATFIERHPEYQSLIE